MLLGIIWTFILGMIFLYLQVLAMPAFTIAQVIPNILIPWVLYLVWTRPRTHVLILVFIIGAMFDTLNPATFGMHALLFCVLAILIDLFRKPFEADSVVAKMLAIAVANIIYALIQLLVLGLTHGFTGELMTLTLISLLYNLLISFVVFWSMQLLSKLRLIVVHD